MTKIKSIDKTAYSAWSPGTKPLIALGSAAGAVDSSFSTSAELDIYDLNLHSKDKMKKISSTSAPAKFNRLAWGDNKSEATPLGVIAAGLENGEIYSWNAQSLIDAKPDAQVIKKLAHRGSVKGLDFNPIQTNLFASGATDGEIFIWDLNSPSKPYSPGSKSQRLDDITFLNWNRQVPHILATASNNGNVVIWDLKNRRELSHLPYPGGKKPITSVAWNPDEPLQIAISADDDYNPSIFIWDLRNATAPRSQMTGHQQSVLSMSWCPKDSDLLMSGGKDNRTIIWDTKTGLPIGELEFSNNWVFETGWSSRNPELTFTASFDGKVSIHSIQNAQPEDEDGPVNEKPNVDDPFTHAVMQGISKNASQGSSLNLTKPPKWFRRPKSCSWSFSGKLIICSNSYSKNLNPSHPNPVQTHTVQIKTISTETTLLSRAQNLRSLLFYSSPQVLADFCHSKLESLSKDHSFEKETWKFLQIMISHGVNEISTFLGVDEEKSKINDIFSKIKISESPTFGNVTKHDLNPLTDVGDLFHPDHDSDIVNQIDSPTRTQTLELPPPFFTSPLKFSTVGAINKEEAEIDLAVSKCVIMGDYDLAVKICLSSNRLADSLILAQQGGSELYLKTRNEYFKKAASKKTYLRLLQDVVYENISDVVEHIDLEEGDGTSWKIAMAFIYTYGSSETISKNLSILGKRLEEGANKKNLLDTTSNKQKKEQRKIASLFCNIGAGNVDKVSQHWSEFETNSSGNVSYLENLQNYIEKVTFYTKTINFQDESIYSQEPLQTYALENLYEKYLEFSKLALDQGCVDLAWEYIKMIPDFYVSQKPGLEKLPAILKNRIYNSGQVQMSNDYFIPLPFEQIDVVEFVPEQVFEATEHEYQGQQQYEYASNQPYQEQYSQQTQQQQYSQNWNSNQQTSGFYPNAYQTPQSSIEPKGPPASSYSNSAQQNPTAPGPNPYQKPPTQTYQQPPTQTYQQPPIQSYQQQPPTQSYQQPPAISYQQKPQPQAPPAFSNPPNQYGQTYQPTVQSGMNSNPYSQPASASYQQPAQNTTTPYSNAPSSYSSQPTPVHTAPHSGPQAPYFNNAADNNPKTPHIPTLPQSTPYQNPQNPIYTSPQSSAPPLANIPPPQTVEASAPKSGDRNNILPHQLKVLEHFDALYRKLNEATNLGPQQRKMLEDAEKKLTILSDQMNARQLKQEVCEKLSVLIKALEANDYPGAHKIQLELMTTSFDVSGPWIVGIKRLIDVAERLHSLKLTYQNQGQIQNQGPIQAGALGIQNNQNQPPQPFVSRPPVQSNYAQPPYQPTNQPPNQSYSAPPSNQSFVNPPPVNQSFANPPPINQSFVNPPPVNQPSYASAPPSVGQQPHGYHISSGQQPGPRGYPQHPSGNPQLGNQGGNNGPPSSGQYTKPDPSANLGYQMGQYGMR